MNKSAWKYLRGRIWYVGWRENGKLAVPFSTGTSNPAEAEIYVARKVLELKNKSNGDPCPEMLLSEAIAVYEKSQINIKPRTVQLNRYTWAKWQARWKTIGDLTRENLVTWIKELTDKYEPNGVSIQLRNLHKIVRFCVQKDYIRKDIFEPGDIPGRQKVHRFLTPEEKEKLLAACINADLRRIVAFNLEVGLRISQAIELDWKQYHVGKRLLYIPPQKRQKARFHPITADILSLMGPMKDEGLVFPGWSYDRLEKMFIRAVRRSKIGGRCRFHDIRHAAVSDNRARYKLDPFELRDLYGWSSVAMTDIYCHTRIEDIQKKMEHVQQ